MVRRPLAVLAIAVGAAYALGRAGSRFPLPQRDIRRWLVDVGPAEAAMSLLRVGALVAASYLAVMALLHLVVPAWSQAGRLVARVTLPSLRTLFVTTALATTSAGAAFAAARAVPPPPVSITLADYAANAALSAPAREYTVTPGDSFWSIASTVITTHLGRPPAVAEIGSYWHQLITANTDRLVHAGVPDLIFPGQVLVLPQP